MQHEGPVDGQFSALHPVPLIEVFTGEAWIAGDATGGYKSLSWVWAKALRAPGVIFLSGETMQHEGPVDGQFSALHPVPLIEVFTGEAWIAGDATGGYKSLSWDWAKAPRDPGVMFLPGETIQHEGAVEGQFSALQPVPLIEVFTGDAWTAGGATGGYRS